MIVAKILAAGMWRSEHVLRVDLKKDVEGDRAHTAHMAMWCCYDIEGSVTVRDINGSVHEIRDAGARKLWSAIYKAA